VIPRTSLGAIALLVGACGGSSSSRGAPSCADGVTAKASSCAIAADRTAATALLCSDTGAASASCFADADCAIAANAILTGRDPCLTSAGDEIDLPKGYQPEGFTRGPDNLAYVGLLTGGGVVRVDLTTGLTDFLVPPGPHTERAIAGVTYVPTHGLIYACGAWFANGFVFDAKTGALLATIDFPRGSQGTLINAVDVRDDAAYFTDSVNPWLDRVPLDANGIPSGPATKLPLSGGWAMVPGLEVANANGIVAVPGTHQLLVLNSANGVIYAVDETTGVATAVDGVTVQQADGLELEGNRLVVVQNAPENRVTVVTLDATMTHATVVANLDDARLQSPTNPVVVGRDLWIVNSRLADVFHGNASADDKFNIVRLDLEKP
jgi:sugar lactone lactonase YvrE